MSTNQWFEGLCAMLYKMPPTNVLQRAPLQSKLHCFFVPCKRATCHHCPLCLPCRSLPSRICLDLCVFERGRKMDRTQQVSRTQNCCVTSYHSPHMNGGEQKAAEVFRAYQAIMNPTTATALRASASQVSLWHFHSSFALPSWPFIMGCAIFHIHDNGPTHKMLSYLALLSFLCFVVRFV